MRNQKTSLLRPVRMDYAIHPGGGWHEVTGEFALGIVAVAHAVGVAIAYSPARV